MGKRGKVKKVKTSKKYILVGGPWTHREAILPEKTIVFRVGGWHGQYVKGEWHDAPPSVLQ